MCGVNYNSRMYSRRVGCGVPWQWVRCVGRAWRIAGAENTVSSTSDDMFVMPSAVVKMR